MYLWKVYKLRLKTTAIVLLFLCSVSNNTFLRITSSKNSKNKKYATCNHGYYKNKRIVVVKLFGNDDISNISVQLFSNPASIYIIHNTRAFALSLDLHVYGLKVLL